MMTTRLVTARCAIPLALALAFILPACSLGPRVETAIAASPNKVLAIYSTRAYAQKKGLLITGSVRRPALFKGAIWGHLHVVGFYEDGRPPVSVDTRWGTLSPRGSRSATFSALLPTSAPLEIKTVRIEYRAEADSKRSMHVD